MFNILKKIMKVGRMKYATVVPNMINKTLSRFLSY